MTALLKILVDLTSSVTDKRNTVKMEETFTKLSSFECFQKFVEFPKGSNMDIIMGSHKFMIEVIRKEKESPSNKTLIKIFDEFSKKPIKNYIFTRMGKTIMQELAICILQDLASNGPSRAESLQLEVVKASSGGKTVQIVDQFDDGSAIDQSFLEEIDSAIFKFKDGSGASPDVSFASGQGHAVPYLPPDDDGEFVTPKKKKVARVLLKDIEVCFLRILLYVIYKFNSHSKLGGRNVFSRWRGRNPQSLGSK